MKTTCPRWMCALHSEVGTGTNITTDQVVRKPAILPLTASPPPPPPSHNQFHLNWNNEYIYIYIWNLNIPLAHCVLPLDFCYQCFKTAKTEYAATHGSWIICAHTHTHTHTHTHYLGQDHSLPEHLCRGVPQSLVVYAGILPYNKLTLSLIILPSRCTHMSFKIWLLSCCYCNIQKLKLCRWNNNQIKTWQLNHMIKNNIGNDEWNHIQKHQTVKRTAN